MTHKNSSQTLDIIVAMVAVSPIILVVSGVESSMGLKQFVEFLTVSAIIIGAIWLLEKLSRR